MQPYPFTNTWRSAWLSAIGVGLFVALFLFVFRPFGTKVTPGAEIKYLGICALFAVVTLLITLIINGLTLAFPALFEEEGWVIWKEVVFNMFVVGGIGFGNLLLAHGLWQVGLNASSFLGWQAITFAIGIFPIIAGVMIGQMKLSRKYGDEAARLAPRPHPVHDSGEPGVSLEGDNQNERLYLPPGHIVYIAAADNYVRVYYLDKGLLKNRMLRATMKKMEDALLPFPYLFRCHRRFLVNIEMVEKVSGNAQGYRLHLQGFEESIPVSRNLNEKVQKMM